MNPLTGAFSQAGTGSFNAGWAFVIDPLGTMASRRQYRPRPLSTECREPAQSPQPLGRRLHVPQPRVRCRNESLSRAPAHSQRESQPRGNCAGHHPRRNRQKPPSASAMTWPSCSPTPAIAPASSAGRSTTTAPLPISRTTSSSPAITSAITVGSPRWCPPAPRPCWASPRPNNVKRRLVRSLHRRLLQTRHRPLGQHRRQRGQRTHHLGRVPQLAASSPSTAPRPTKSTPPSTASSPPTGSPSWASTRSPAPSC